MFFRFENFYSLLGCPIHSIHSFKVFRRSTKFKRYNRGITKFIMNRRRYIVRKKVANEISKFLIPLSWSQYFSTKRQFTRFFQLLFIIPLTLPLVSQELVKNSLETLVANRSFTALSAFNVNAASLTKSLLCNKSLFIPHMMTSFLSLFDYTRCNVLLACNTHNINPTNSLITGGLLDKNTIGAWEKHSRAHTTSNTLGVLNTLYFSIKFKMLKLVLGIVSQIRILITRLVLLNLFK